MNRVLAASPVAAFAFVGMLAVAAVAVRTGFMSDEALRLWAGASTAADGDVPIGRIVAAYPTLPFIVTTLVSWLAPAGTPAPALVAAGLLALLAGCSFLALCRSGLNGPVALIATVLIAFHPALLRAAIGGPSDMFLAVFLLILCLSLYDLRSRSGASEVMAVGLTLLALAFSHPMGAAITFAAVPFLAFAVPPVLVASSALNVVLALIFPTLFAIGTFAYVSWVFPGDGWSFFASPAQSLSIRAANLARVFGEGLSGSLAIDAGLAMGAALAIGAPLVVVMLILVRRRRPLVTPALVFAAAVIAAAVISVGTGLFGDPAAIAVAAPVLAAAVMTRIPVARERIVLALVLLAVGWLGGAASIALVDPTMVAQVRAAAAGTDGEQLDALAAGGAATKLDGVLVDIDNTPAFLLGRGRARGIDGSSSDAFALAMLFSRIESPVVAVPDPQTAIGANDRLDRAFPTLFRQGLEGYRIIYQNNTWRLFSRVEDDHAHKD